MEGVASYVTEAERLTARRERAIKNIEFNPFVNIVTRKRNGEHFILRVINPDTGAESTVDFYPSSLEWIKRKSYARGMGVGRLFSFFKIRIYKERRC